MKREPRCLKLDLEIGRDKNTKYVSEPTDTVVIGKSLEFDKHWGEWKNGFMLSPNLSETVLKTMNSLFRIRKGRKGKFRIIIEKYK